MAASAQPYVKENLIGIHPSSPAVLTPEFGNMVSSRRLCHSNEEFIDKNVWAEAALSVSMRLTKLHFLNPALIFYKKVSRKIKVTLSAATLLIPSGRLYILNNTIVKQWSILASDPALAQLFLGSSPSLSLWKTRVFRHPGSGRKCYLFTKMPMQSDIQYLPSILLPVILMNFHTPSLSALNTLNCSMQGETWKER